MKFIKNHVYACTFTRLGTEPSTFYGIYTHTQNKSKHFKFISAINYGTWNLDIFTIQVSADVIFTALGTIKQNPELFI